MRYKYWFAVLKNLKVIFAVTEIDNNMFVNLLFIKCIRPKKYTRRETNQKSSLYL